MGFVGADEGRRAAAGVGIRSLRVCETGTRDARSIRHRRRASLCAVHTTGIYIYIYMYIYVYMKKYRATGLSTWLPALSV